MDAEIPYEIDQMLREFLAICVGQCIHPDMYYTGGCLLAHPTNDYDVLVMSDMESANALELTQKLYAEHRCESIDCHTAYAGEECEYHTIVTLHRNGIKVDLLFVDEDDYTVPDILDMYPLSIQMVARNILSGSYIKGPRHQSEPCVVYMLGKSYNKYKTYYPDLEFVLSDKVQSQIDNLKVIPF